jgi:hypothetical protein
MKNLKLVSYREWSSIYESLNKDSKATQRVLESKLIGIYEAVLTQTKVTFPEGLIVDKRTRGTYGGVDAFGDDLEITIADNQIVYETAMRTVDSIPGATFLYASAITSAAKNVELKLDVFKLIIAGIGNSVGIENLADELIKDPKLMENLKLKATLDKTFNTFGKDGMMYVDVKVGTDGSFNSKTGTSSNLVKPSIVCGVLNTQNLVNWVNGSFSQWVDLSKAIGTGGDNFSISSGLTDLYQVEQGALYLFTSAASSEGSTTPVVQQSAAPSRGVSIPWGELDFNYDEDGALIDQDYSEIKELIKQIVSELKPNEIITKLQLTSITKPMWQGNTTSGSGTGEPVGQNNVKLADQTFKADKTALGNQWLAWKRGTTVANELYETFGTKIQKGAIEVMWKIENVAATGSNISYSIVTKTASPTPIANTPAINNALGTQASNPNATIPISRYKITFDGSVIAKALPGKLKKVIGIGASTVPFEDLAVGNSIKYKGMTDGKIDDKSTKSGKVLSVSGDGKVTIEAESGNKITITKDRFISGQKAKGGEAVED